MIKTPGIKSWSKKLWKMDMDSEANYQYHLIMNTTLYIIAINYSRAIERKNMSNCICIKFDWLLFYFNNLNINSKDTLILNELILWNSCIDNDNFSENKLFTFYIMIIKICSFMYWISSVIYIESGNI